MILDKKASYREYYEQDLIGYYKRAILGQNTLWALDFTGTRIYDQYTLQVHQTKYYNKNSD